MRVLIAAGGTAGHINPALAIAGALKKADPSAEIHFAGRKEGMEYRLVTQAGYPFHHIEITGFQRKLSPTTSSGISSPCGIWPCPARWPRR